MGDCHEDRLVVRSLLFVPGTRPDRIPKAMGSAADAVVVDLEDAVSAADKSAARHAVRAVLAERASTGTVVLVRINPADTPWCPDDVRAAVAANADGVVLPKYQCVEELVWLRDQLGEAGGRETAVVVGIETARGVADSHRLLDAAPAPPAAAYFGAEDYISDLGGHRTEAGNEVLYARSEVSLAARLAGIPAIDQAVVAVRDDERFLRDAEFGRAIGYAGKICLHPRQAELARSVFTPSTEDVDHARAVLRAGKSGVAVVDGQLVDEVHLRMARQVLAGVSPERAGGAR
ncbi:MAG: CoA ester lyase [Actinophytocola sp.]|nr:CoA ester lyase [Actinophytocola sp.]